MDETDAFSGGPIKYSRGDFDKHLDVDQNRFTQFVNDFIKSQNLTWESCDGILILGGTSLVPYLKNLLKTQFPTKLLMNIHAEESVSKGAARYAASFLSEKLRINMFQSTDRALSLITQPNPESTVWF